MKFLFSTCIWKCIRINNICNRVVIESSLKGIVFWRYEHVQGEETFSLKSCVNKIGLWFEKWNLLLLNQLDSALWCMNNRNKQAHLNDKQKLFFCLNLYKWLWQSETIVDIFLDYSFSYHVSQLCNIYKYSITGKCKK